MEKEKLQSFRRASFKTVLYLLILFVLLFVLKVIFGWSLLEDIPPYLQPYSNIILFVNPYLVYIQAGLVFIFGYLAINAIASLIYTYMRRISDHPTAATLRTITRISGIAVLLSMMSSFLNVNPAAALTVGSFGGLVVGFATQTILSHVVAGVFLLISRPFTYGDIVTVAGQTGVVKEVKLMHLVLKVEDGTKEILIPSGNVVTQIIQKKIPSAIQKPTNTVLFLNAPSDHVIRGSSIVITGNLVEETSGNPVSDMTVKIFDKDIGGDDQMASGITEKDGRFNIEWIAKKMDPSDNTVEIYAKFEGNDNYLKSESKKYIIIVE
jgi:small-conductance mechanosensitive channel